ncbi:MAG: hypothetical protein HY908_05430 [Myxococcales bacterium]|nr:hypothetical protein [Myxococcales bacterium]
MACSVCFEVGHNAATCPVARRCSNCGGVGHYATTCPRMRRCGNCGKRGHYATTCPHGEADRVCSLCGTAGHNRATCSLSDGYVDPIESVVDRIEDVPIPRGRRVVNLEADGWLGAHLPVSLWKERTDEYLRALRTYERLRPAFKALVTEVHRACNHVLYVGRAGANPNLLRSRFDAHRAERGAQFIKPVFRVATQLARDARWEVVAIRWMMRRHDDGTLCCNNTAADDRGQWPATEDTVVYVVTC